MISGIVIGVGAALLVALIILSLAVWCLLGWLDKGSGF